MNSAMPALINDHGVNVQPLPADVMMALKAATDKVLAKQVAADEDFAKIYASYKTFYDGISAYHELSEKAYYENR